MIHVQWMARLLMVATCAGMMTGQTVALAQTPGKSARIPAAQRKAQTRRKAVDSTSDKSKAVSQIDNDDPPLPGEPIPDDLGNSSSMTDSYKSFWGEKIEETPYGSINGKPYRPAPDDYYTRSRVLHPQVIRGWGYNVNAANHGADYSGGILPSDYPVPVRGSNVTFILPDRGYATDAVPQQSYGYSQSSTGSPIVDLNVPGATVYVQRGSGPYVSGPYGSYGAGQHDFGEAANGAGSSYGYGSYGTGSYGYGSKWYMANYNWPNSASSANVPANSDPVNFHYGPGLHRSGVSGHYRFPYYSYRRPWYHPGDASFQRNTQFPW